MEVVFPVAFGVIVALATIGMFALARVALPGLRDWWAGRRESARAMRRPVLRTAPAARYTSPRPRRPLVPVMDPAIRATPVRSPEQIHWSMAVRGAGAAVDGAGTVGGNGIGGGAAAAGGDAGMDVEGHGVASRHSRTSWTRTSATIRSSRHNVPIGRRTDPRTARAALHRGAAARRSAYGAGGGCVAMRMPSQSRRRLQRMSRSP